MRRITLTLLTGLVLTFSGHAQDYTTTVFDEVVFYDGYADTYTEPAPPEGIVRMSNSRYAAKLSETQLDGIQDTFSIDVTIGALCDNYDRQGGVFLALVPAGEDIDSENKQVMEVGRFITPFMDKNVMPDEVPYHYELSHLAGLFQDEVIRDNYDIWVEFFLFGVPYAANTEIDGCEGRSDVFRGTIVLNSSVDEDNPASNYIPKPLWSRLQMNKTNNSDEWGTAVRLVNFSNEEELTDAHVQLITSAHGANSGGEEYIRRDHFVYFNGEQVLTYRPGGESCEPFRQYNTQPNGIYSLYPRTDADWAQWNNWCPGAAIPSRFIELGDVPAGEHQFKLTVPTGQFPNDNDEIVLSAFIYSADHTPLDNEYFQITDYVIYPNPASDRVQIESSEAVKLVRIFNLAGQKVLETSGSQINIENLSSGSYLLELNFENGVKTTEKLIKQ